MSSTQHLIKQLHTERQAYLKQLLQLIAFPSISTEPDHAADVLTTAEWIARRLESAGLENVKVMDTDGLPVVYADWLHAGSDRDTMLVYGHLDVQPPGDISLWTSGPFKPEARGGYVFGRGAADMKGPLLASIIAIELAIKNGSLPVNVKFLIESEEELGSPNLERFIQDHQDLLSADFCLNPDAGMLRDNTPSIMYALRGMSFSEVIISGPREDLHSGTYGGIVLNPIFELARLIGLMIDSNGMVQLPGFYDSVSWPGDKERLMLEKLGKDKGFFMKQTGAPDLWGRTGFSFLERTTVLPTIEFNGFLSGYTLPGMKTIIPATASVKISCRLVADQDPGQVHAQLVEFIKQNISQAVTFKAVHLSGTPAFRTDISLPIVQAYAEAQEEVWGKATIFAPNGGTIGAASQMKSILRLPSILCGPCLPSSKIHGPDENLHIETWLNFAAEMLHFFYIIASQ